MLTKAVAVAVIFSICGLLYIKTGSKTFLVSATIFLISLLGFSMYLLPNNTGERPLTQAEIWEKFKQDNDCKVVEKREGHSTGGVGLSTRTRFY